MNLGQEVKPKEPITETGDKLGIPEQYVAVAIPYDIGQSRNLKASLEAHNIPVLLEHEIVEIDADLLGGIPVLVPECKFEQASEIIGDLELNAISDEDEDEDFDELEDEDTLDFDEDEELDDWDDDLDFDEDEDFEDEDELEGFDEEFDEEDEEF